MPAKKCRSHFRTWRNCACASLLKTTKRCKKGWRQGNKFHDQKYFGGARAKKQKSWMGRTTRAERETTRAEQQNWPSDIPCDLTGGGGKVKVKVSSCRIDVNRSHACQTSKKQNVIDVLDLLFASRDWLAFKFGWLLFWEAVTCRHGYIVLLGCSVLIRFGGLQVLFFACCQQIV